MGLQDGYTSVRTFRSANGQRELVIFRRPDGLFGYIGDKLSTEDGYTFWAPAEWSGIYQTAAEAERAALAEVIWLREENSN